MLIRLLLGVMALHLMLVVLEGTRVFSRQDRIRMVLGRRERVLVPFWVVRARMLGLAI